MSLIYICLQISNMTEKVPSFKSGGAYWFLDLTTPDSLYILPILTGLTFWITVEVGPLLVKLSKEHFLVFLVVLELIEFSSCFTWCCFMFLSASNYPTFDPLSVQHARRSGRKSHCWHHEKSFTGLCSCFSSTDYGFP